jgi:hypothetical protein
MNAFPLRASLSLLLLFGFLATPLAAQDELWAKDLGT